MQHYNRLFVTFHPHAAEEQLCREKFIASPAATHNWTLYRGPSNRGSAVVLIFRWRHFTNS